MAFPSGHVAPAGFVAGPLVDGASLGKFAMSSSNGIAAGGTLEIKVLYRSAKLIGVMSITSAAGTAIYTNQVKQRNYFLNLYNGNYFTSPPPTLQTIINLLADDAGLASAGLTAVQTAPASTGVAIPFSLSADGVLAVVSTGSNIDGGSGGAGTSTFVDVNKDGYDDNTGLDVNGKAQTGFVWPIWASWVLAGLGFALLGYTAYILFMKKGKKGK